MLTNKEIKMKNIRIKSVLCVALATSSLCAGAQNLSSELFDADSDSLSVAEEELVQVAYRKVNKNDLLGGVSSINVEELMKKIILHTVWMAWKIWSVAGMEVVYGGWIPIWC